MSEIRLSQNSYALILGVCLLILFLPYPVWPQAIPIELFQATLTIEQTDTNTVCEMDTNTICEEGGISKSILLFGFDQPERIISPPKTSTFCILASFDPNTTIADGRTFDPEHGDNIEWMVAFLPSHPLRGTWGIRITYPEPDTTADLRFTWKPKGLAGFPPGRFFINRGLSNVQVTKGINMKDTNSIAVKDVANNEIVKIEYYHDNCLFDTNIPSKEDSYEPEDNDPNKATMYYYDQKQIHTFHDPNDIDWIKFWASKGNYYIYLTPLCPQPIDPNIVPFEVSLFIGYNHLTLPPLEAWSLNTPVYWTTWENRTEEDVYIEIKINPEMKYLGFLPYLFSLERTNLGVDVKRQILKINAKNRSYIDYFSLKSNNSREECNPPLAYDYALSDPNFLLYEFICYFTIASDSFSLWLLDRVLDDNFEIPRNTVDLDDYLSPIHPDSFPPPPHDPDCDGIIGEEDPNPNSPNILFRAGMNLYHHPFHPYNFTTCLQKEIELCEEFSSYLTSFKKASLFINQNGEHVGTWYHYPIESGCNDIFLSNNAGCLLYSLDDLTLVNEDYIWGKCFTEVIDPNTVCGPNKPMFDPNDPNNLIIELAPGLNIVGLSYYEAFTFEEKKGSEFRTFGDQSVDSFALLRSINSPTTSLEISAHLIDSNLLMDTPKSQVYPEQKISSSVLRYDSRSGKWSYCTTFFGHPSGDRFDVGIDEAYLVYFDIQDPNNTSHDPNKNQRDPNMVRGKNWYPAIFFWP